MITFQLNTCLIRLNRILELQLGFSTYLLKGTTSLKNYLKDKKSSYYQISTTSYICVILIDMLDVNNLDILLSQIEFSIN